ncbi:hypothetical protein [Pseudanabaena sp. FACHB-1998]|uniref:hypothetical protein n=1 Tax=Pseudanabaena sp. FACHB-1998 TaxID=2692858 RepID=UPI0018EFC6AF|nr:hypothetical protein [Pseudanabaena sp. FACHB-1998]
MTETSDWSDLETQLQETKKLLAEIEQRFLQVRRDSVEQQDLLKQQEIIKQQLQEDPIDRLNANNNFNNKSNSQNSQSKIRRKPSPTDQTSTDYLKDELNLKLQEISDRLEQIEADLESRLLSWSSFREPFWQIVRFGGLGIIIGVILRSCVN